MEYRRFNYKSTNFANGNFMELGKAGDSTPRKFLSRRKKAKEFRLTFTLKNIVLVQE